MTREEAIERLNTIGEYYSQDHSDSYEECERLAKDELDALNMAIKALEQEPSGDLISREAVLDGIEELKKSPWATDTRGTGFEYLITEALEVVAELCVKQALSVNPKEPKTGHWIDDTRLGYHVSICSNCDWRGHGDTCLIYKPKYCPNCGARMAESEDKG